MKQKNTSWEKVGAWYDKIVGKDGHYYHKQVVIPGVLKLLALQNDSALLDLACGQGILSRQIPESCDYFGIDISKTLIDQAKKYAPEKQFAVGDVTKPLPIKNNRLFSHAAILLALQNIESAENVIKNASLHLEKEGAFVIVLNHPAFRIPRQSSWMLDPQNKMQKRVINGYMTEQKIPITAHPSQGEVTQTWSFHKPLSAYAKMLISHGFVIDAIEEWCSDKTSSGKYKAAEDRARREFPLFLAIRAKKLLQ